METIELWNSYMQSYDFLNHVEGYRSNMNDIVAAFGELSEKTVLDAGSGTGNLSLKLKGSGAVVQSCDFSPVAIEVHRQKDPAAQITQASLEAPLPFQTGSFDGVCCASVLFALSESGCRLALSEFLRVLRPGGKLVLTVAAQTASASKLGKMHWMGLVAKFGVTVGLIKWLIDLPHLARIAYYSKRISALPDWKGFHRFSEEELRRSLQGTGFRQLRLDRTYGNGFFLVTAVKPLKS